MSRERLRMAVSRYPLQDHTHEALEREKKL